MALAALQTAGLVLGFFGMAGTLAATLLPQWRVSAFVGSNLIVAERLWEGLWVSCVRQGRAALQCKAYGSLLALPAALEAARALMCVSVALSLAALIVGVCGMRRVQCAGANEEAKASLLGASGVLFVLTGVSVLTPVSWTAHAVIRDFRDPAVHVAQKRELGAALFLGWASATVLLVTGTLLCASCCRNRGRPRRGYPAPRPRGPHPGRRRVGALPSKPATSYV